MPGPLFAEGERIGLHTVEAEDAEFLQSLVNHPEVRPTVAQTEPINLDEEREWVTSLDEVSGSHFLICADGEPVGICGLNDPNEIWGVAEAGYMLHPDAWNNGYATDAVRQLCAYAFEERRFGKVVAKCYATNPASRRVLEKAGFTEEGVLRKEAFAGGERVDVYRFGLLADEWRD